MVIRKRKMSVLNIPMQNHKPKRTPSEMKDQKVNTGIFKPVTRLTVEKIPVYLKEQTSIHSFCNQRVEERQVHGEAIRKDTGGHLW